MMKKVKPAYRFLFQTHSTGTVRFLMAMIIPCAFSATFCKIWMLILCMVELFAIYADEAGWNRMEEE